MLSAGAFVARGGKKHAVENPEDWEQWLAPQSLQALAAKDTRWLAANVTKNYQRSVEYAGNILQRQGAEVLDAPIMISIGTIHSVKGGEADVVYVFPDVSNAGSEEMETLAGRDAAIRLGYVAMTRAREELVLCEPIGINELGIG
tara:strand:+ start:62 stop:496 length:435 start_codon:yes stop_codon:yes gene_type:complete